MHLTANLASSIVDFADFGEEGSDLVAAEKTSCPSLQQVTQAGLDSSWRERRRVGIGKIDKRGEQGKDERLLAKRWRTIEIIGKISVKHSLCL